MPKPIDYEHPLFKKNLPIWQMIDDICDFDNVQKYIVELNPLDTSEDNQTRNKQYKERALFYYIAGYTCNGLIGLAFRKAPKVEIPLGIDYIKDDVDGDGTTLNQQAIDTFEAVLRKGRAVLLVDMPRRPEGVSASVAAMKAGYSAHIRTIPAQNVIDWERTVVGGKSILSKVAIKDVLTNDDGEEVEKITTYLLTSEGAQVSVAKKMKNEKEFVTIPEEGGLLFKGDGSRLKYIPIVFCGSRNNTVKPDPAPMRHICEINKAHYNNSASYEDSVHIVGQVQPWMSGLNQSHIDLLKENKMYIGSRELLPVPSGEQFGFSQAQPNMIVKEAMDSKVEMSVGLGALFVQPGSAVKTATQIAGEQAVSHSVLSLVATNVGDAYEIALQIVCDFDNVEYTPESIEYVINQDFIRKNVDAQTIQAIVGAWQGDAIRIKDMVRHFQSVDVIDPNDPIEDVIEEIQGQKSSMPDLDE